MTISDHSAQRARRVTAPILGGRELDLGLARGREGGEDEHLRHHARPGRKTQGSAFAGRGYAPNRLGGGGRSVVETIPVRRA